MDVIVLLHLGMLRDEEEKLALGQLAAERGHRPEAALGGNESAIELVNRSELFHRDDESKSLAAHWLTLKILEG